MMHGRRRWGERLLWGHRRGPVESAACLQLFNDALCDLGDEIRRYIVRCFGACLIEGFGYSLVDGPLRRGVSVLFRHH